MYNVWWLTQRVIDRVSWRRSHHSNPVSGKAVRLSKKKRCYAYFLWSRFLMALMLWRKDQTNQCLHLWNWNIFIKHGWMLHDLVQLGNLLKGYSSLSNPLGIQTANRISFHTWNLNRRAVSQMQILFPEITSKSWWVRFVWVKMEKWCVPENCRPKIKIVHI